MSVQRGRDGPVHWATMNAVTQEITREEPILPIRLVSNPLQTPVPQPWEEEDVVPLGSVSAFPVPATTDPYGPTAGARVGCVFARP